MPDEVLPKVTALPDRLYTWCKVPMRKRLVGGEHFVYYTCPKCLSQHTRRLRVQSEVTLQVGDTKRKLR